MIPPLNARTRILHAAGKPHCLYRI